MIKPQDVKEEEKRIITPNQYVGIIKVEKQGNSTISDSYQKTLEKFYIALLRLQEAQYLGQNEVTPKYPFVFQYSFNQIMVHLGSHQLQQQLIEDLKKYDYQQQFFQKSKPVPQLKLSVQKRKGFSTLEQKDSKNIPKNYCKAIISYAQKNQTLCQEILKEEIKVARFIEYLTNQKKKSLNIRVFKALLQQSEDPLQDEFNRTFRIIRQLISIKLVKSLLKNTPLIIFIIQKSYSIIGILDIDNKYIRESEIQKDFPIQRNFEILQCNQVRKIFFLQIIKSSIISIKYKYYELSSECCLSYLHSNRNGPEQHNFLKEQFNQKKKKVRTKVQKQTKI